MANYQSKFKGKQLDAGVEGGLNSIRYDTPQNLTDEQKHQAQVNLGIDDVNPSIETLTEEVNEITSEMMIDYVANDQCIEFDKIPEGSITTKSLEEQTEFNLITSKGNLLIYPYYDSNTYFDHGVTFVVNNDGSITATGRASGGNAIFRINMYSGFSWIPETEVYLSGCTNGSPHTYYLEEVATQTKNYNGFTPIEIESNINLRVVIYEGMKVNTTFYPMISLSEIEYVDSARMHTAEVDTPTDTYTWDKDELDLTDGNNTFLVPFPDSLEISYKDLANLQDIVDKVDDIESLPELPTIKGKYKLIGNVSDNSSVISWESEELDPMTTVKFISYDGTVICEYSKNDFLKLSTMPTPPAIQGMTFQEWNWSLADAKAHVLEFDSLVIGATYVTNDGKTRLYVHLDSPKLAPSVGFGINGTATIDWGDGSATSTVTGSSVSNYYHANHEYAESGDYVITIDGQINIFGHHFDEYDSSYLFRANGDVQVNNGDKVYSAFVNKIELGNIYGIGYYAFYSFDSMETINLPSMTATAIGSSSFPGCTSLKAIVIPQGIASIGEDSPSGGAFGSCYDLKYISIPRSVTAIKFSAFGSCYSLKEIDIPSYVVELGNQVFSGCRSLKRAFVPELITTIPEYLFNECHSLESVRIFGAVTSIGRDAFYNCYNLRSVNIPNSVDSIGYQAFYDCRSLEALELPDALTTIGVEAFGNCRTLQSLVIPDSVTSMARGVVRGCYNLKTATLPAGITVINESTFSGCSSLKLIEIPSGVLTIGDNAFFDCDQLESVTIPNTVTSIGNQAFRLCDSLKTVTIPNSVTSIGSGAFSSCTSLNSVSFSNQITTISSSMFENNYRLITIVVPELVASIGSSAFRKCEGLGEIHFLPTTPPTVGNYSYVFEKLPRSCKIYVPTDSYDAYTTATNYPSPSTYEYIRE